jgi:hypothetical protein
MHIKSFNSLIYLVIAFLVIACEMQADLKNTVDYKDSEISFTIPGNWKITSNENIGGFRYLIIETTGDALVMLNIFPGKEPGSLEEYVENFIDGSTKNFALGKRNKGTIMQVKTVVDGRVFSGYKNQFTVSLASVEDPHTSYFYYFESDSRVAYLSTQVASEYIDKVQEGFELTLSTTELQ